MNNPGVAGTGGSVYDRTCDFFRKLANSGTFRLSYRAATTVPGFETLATNDRAPVFSVWKQDGDLRVLVAGVVDQSAAGTYAAEGSLADPLPKAGAAKWFAFADGRLLQAAEPPPGFASADENGGIPAGMEVRAHLSPYLLTPHTAPYRYPVAQWKEKAGFWRCAPGREPVLLVEGNVAMPIVTPDGKWAVLAKTDTDWSKPNYVLRVDLMTGRAYRLDIPVADTLNPVAWVSAHGRVLLERSRDEAVAGDRQRPVGPEKPQFYLVDPATGASRLVEGEFDPLRGQSLRPLQPAGQPGVVWAAWLDRETGRTAVGLYDTNTFTFRPRLSLPLQFHSMQMWVDVGEKKLYVAYNGHLLRMDLPAQ